MSLSRPAGPAGPTWPVSSEHPPEGPAAASASNKRPRLEESGGVSEAGWPLLVVPRLSEVEKIWEWSLRPFTEFLIPQYLGPAGNGRQRCDLGWRDRTFQMQNCWPCGISGRAGCSRVPGRSCEPGLQDREALGMCHGDQAEVSHVLPDTSLPAVQGVKPEPEELPVRGKDNILKEENSVRQPGKLFLDTAFSEETKLTLHEIKDRCKVDSVITSDKKENNVSSSTLKISKSQNRACLESAKPSYFRDSITIIFPEFPRDLNSNMSFVYLKEIAKKKNDKIVAYVRDFTNIFWSQNRPDAKKQKLQGDKKNVFVENDFSDYYESNHQSLFIQNNVEGKIDLISLNYYHHSSIQCDVRDSKKNLTPEDANWKGTERSLACHIPTRQEESQIWDYNKSILNRKRQNCWIMNDFKIICENTKKLGEKLNLAQLIEIDLLNEGDYHNTKVRNVPEQQAKSLMIGTLSALPNLVKVVWFNDKDENASMLQLRYYTIQKYISGNEDSTLTCRKMMTREKQIDIQNLITSKMNDIIKSGGILSKYLQNSILELLSIILKTNIVSLPDNFGSFTRNGGDWESEDGCIFKCIVHLNYLKNIIKESYIVYLTKMLTSSRPLENNSKSKKRKLFKVEHVLEGAKRQNINSLTITTKGFPVYKPHENILLLVDFDNKGLSLTKEPGSERESCPKRLLNVENWAYSSFNSATTSVKSDPGFVQNDCRHINEKYSESRMHHQDLDIERKQKQKTTHIILKFLFEDVFNVRQPGTLLSQDTRHSDQMNAMAITQKLSWENVKGETEGERYDFIVSNEVKVTKTSLSRCQAHKATDGEMEEDSFSLTDRIPSVQSASLVSKNVNVEETKSANQNNGMSTKEDGGILQEIKLANSKHFHQENDSTLYDNHQFGSDSSEENKECFQSLTAKCLSKETLPIAKDFVMKSKFDLVLEELRMFHEISKENEIPSTMETNNRKENYFGESNDIKEARMEIENDLEMVETNERHGSSLPCKIKTGLNKHKGRQGLFNWKTIPTHGGQVVPNEYCPTSEEELLHSTCKEDNKKPLPKSSAFYPDEYNKENYKYLLKGGSHFSHGISRVQPLKTCNRPIRVGLSRRARLEQLHPYLK